MASPWSDEEKLAACHFAVANTVTEAAKKYGVQRWTITTWMRKFGFRISRRKRMEPMQ